MKDAGKKQAASPVVQRQARAVKTRADLMQAARKVFAKSGFEQARLEDIARLAGKTRGAFYANFKDKEEVFFAILEASLEEDRGVLRDTMKRCASMKQRLQAFAQYLLEVIHDRELILLHIEFKTYAIRNPKRKRLAELLTKMIDQYVAQEVGEFIPALRDADARSVVSGVIDGLALNVLFDPEPPSDAVLEQVILAVLQQVVGKE